MTILTLRSDKPMAELGIYEDHKQLAYLKWQAHLELSITINKKLAELLNKLSISQNDMDGIVCFSGPGSFTGLRIGLSVANALAYAQNLPIVAKSGKGWLKAGIRDLQKGKNDIVALPEYGRPAFTTLPK